VTAGGEQGLLSVAFPPEYAQSGLFYVYYTEKSGSEAIWEYHRASEDRADPNSARLVLRMDDPEPNHNGGLMIFGPDKLMYVGTGDGGGRQRPARRPRQRAVARLAAGQDPAHRPQAVGRQALHHPVLEPVRRTRGRARRDLLLRAAQPVALLVRQRH
jgi:glucose/arabinose dehydrogenase